MMPTFSLTFSLTNISNVPFEGMACGCGVVELDSPNVSTMIAAGEELRLLAPFEAGALADALSRLVEEPDAPDPASTTRRR